MEKLHQLDHCPEFAHDILEVIQNGLLIPDKILRWDCLKVVHKLGEIRQKCDSDAAYCLAPQERKGKSVEAFTVLVTEFPRPNPAMSFYKSDS